MTTMTRHVHGTFCWPELATSDAAAAGSTLMQQMRDNGVPPHWAACVAVDDADEAAARAKSLGG